MAFYDTIEGYPNRFNDSLVVYILPIINIYSFCCNVITAMILSKSKLTGDVNQYMLVESIITSIYCLISSFISIIRCGTLCPWGYDYLSKLYELYIFIFVGDSIEFFKFIINLIMSIIKYRSFSIQIRNQPNNKKNFYFILFSTIMISFIINILPTYFCGSIVETTRLQSNQSFEKSTIKATFILARNNYKNDLFKNIIKMIVPSLFLILLISIVILNLMISFELKRFHIRKLSTISLNNSSNISSKDIRKTKLLISYCINAMIGNLTNKLQFIMFYFLDNYSYSLYNTIGYGLLWLSHGNIFLINFCFNQEFNRTLAEMLGIKSENKPQNFGNNNSTQLTTTF